jgi:hypothetical protein
VHNFPNDFGKKGDRFPHFGDGSIGSGRFRTGQLLPVRLQGTENCLSIDVRNWQRDRWLETGHCFTTSWWRRYRKDSSVGVRVLGDLGVGGRAYTVELSYSWGLDGHREDISYPISLSWTPCNFGGSRPWFVCPGVVNGVSCEQRVGKLYLKGRYFLCRHCHNLTYSSQQEARRHAALRR